MGRGALIISRKASMELGAGSQRMSLKIQMGPSGGSPYPWRTYLCNEHPLQGGMNHPALHCVLVRCSGTFDASPSRPVGIRTRPERSRPAFSFMPPFSLPTMDCTP